MGEGAAEANVGTAAASGGAPETSGGTSEAEAGLAQEAAVAASPCGTAGGTAGGTATVAPAPTVAGTPAVVTPRPITHEDVWLMKRVGGPVLSPDGTRVVFSVTDPAYDPKEQSSDLWLVMTDGSSAPRRLTHSRGAEAGATWSPDGSRLAFSAKRDGDDAPQVYVLNLETGGEAERITQLSTGARGPQWSPDGQRILFSSDVYPGAKDDAANKRAAKERKDRPWTARVYDGFPIRYWDQWLDDRRPSLFVQEARAGAVARDILAGTELVAKRGFAGRLSDAGQSLSAAWTPDGEGVVFVATIERDRAAYADTSTDLYLVGLKGIDRVGPHGGEPQALTAGPDDFGGPVFTPDGRHLLLSFSPGGDGKVYHHSRVVSFPWPMQGASRVDLTASLDLSIADFVLLADGRTVLLAAEEGAHTRLFSVPVTGGPVTPRPLQGAGVISSLAAEAGRIVASSESAMGPPELVEIELATGARKPLTRFNADRLAPLDLRPLVSFVVTSALGRPVETLVLRPAGFDPARRYPVLVVIHGGPAPQFRDAWSVRWNYQLLAAPGYVLVMTNYSGSRGYTEAFGQAIQGDPLKTPADEINQGLDEALRRYPFLDGNRVAAAGASYGGHLVNWLQATTTRYRAFVSHAGLVNLESQWATSDVIYHREVGNGGPVWEQGPIWREQNPARLAGNHAKGTGWRTPMLLTVGENDFRVPLNNTLENWSFHQRLQIPSRLIVFPDENHWILKGENGRFWYREVQGWLAQWLK
ncbi:MAG: S9 family peptidase [Verrucomicrobia bacterium]|nr:S9 family peptidase [Verrucomicrobiota bacterium]